MLISDREPTAQAAAVSRELMDNVARELAKMVAILAGDVAEVNRQSIAAGVRHVSA